MLPPEALLKGSRGSRVRGLKRGPERKSSVRLRKESGVRADVVACRMSEFEEDRHKPNALACEAAIRIRRQIGMPSTCASRPQKSFVGGFAG